MTLLDRYRVLVPILAILATGCLAGAPATTINVDTTARQTMTYGMDFKRMWHWGLDAPEATRLADLAVRDCAVDYVRVAIDGKAEFNEGEFDPTAYTMQLECMTLLKRARPDVKFFISPNSFHHAIRARYGRDSPQGKSAPYTCYPLWVGIFENPYDRANRKFLELKWDKAAEYMARHIRFFTEKGFDITYVDLKNECDRYYHAPELSKMAARMHELLGDRMPRIVAPSSYHREIGVQWLTNAIQHGNADWIDVVSFHNTKPKGSSREVVQSATPLGKPVWNTELHGFVGPDDVAAENTAIIWEHIRGGVSGINDWLSLGNEKKTHKMFRNIEGKLEVMRTYYIFKMLVNSSGGGRYLRTNVPECLTSTAAFIKDKALTVWVLNAGDTVVKDVTISLTGHDVSAAPVEVLWWGPENPREGSRTRLELAGDTLFRHDIQPKTLYCFTATLN